MRMIHVTCLALAAAGAAGAQDFSGGAVSQHKGDGEPRGRLFISPMGEPFRSEKGAADPVDLWFQQADTNHDGALSRDEFQKDASRWFAALDRDHDGEIDPDDIEYYETVLAPEIRVRGVGGAGGGGGGMRGGGGRGGGGHRGGGMGGGGGHRGGGGSSGGDIGGQSGRQTRDTEGKQGAARYGFFDYPEPITVADINFNRGIDPTEFRKAADDRFDVLVRSHDGLIHRADLPKISEMPAGIHGRRPSGRGLRQIPPDQRPSGYDPDPADQSNAPR